MEAHCLTPTYTSQSFFGSSSTLFSSPSDRELSDEPRTTKKSKKSPTNPTNAQKRRKQDTTQTKKPSPAKEVQAPKTLKTSANSINFLPQQPVANKKTSAPIIDNQLQRTHVLPRFNLPIIEINPPRRIYQAKEGFKYEILLEIKSQDDLGECLGFDSFEIGRDPPARLKFSLLQPVGTPETFNTPDGKQVVGKFTICPKGTKDVAGPFRVRLRFSKRSELSFDCQSSKCCSLYTRNKLEGLVALASHVCFDDLCPCAANHENLQKITEIAFNSLDRLSATQRRLNEEEFVRLDQKINNPEKIKAWRLFLYYLQQEEIRWLWDHYYLHVFLSQREVEDILEDYPPATFLIHFDSDINCMIVHYYEEANVRSSSDTIKEDDDDDVGSECSYKNKPGRGPLKHIKLKEKDIKMQNCSAAIQLEIQRIIEDKRRKYPPTFLKTLEIEASASTPIEGEGQNQKKEEESSSQSSPSLKTSTSSLTPAAPSNRSQSKKRLIQTVAPDFSPAPKKNQTTTSSGKDASGNGRDGANSPSNLLFSRTGSGLGNFSRPPPSPSPPPIPSPSMPNPNFTKISSPMVSASGIVPPMMVNTNPSQDEFLRMQYQNMVMTNALYQMHYNQMMFGYPNLQAQMPFQMQYPSNTPIPLPMIPFYPTMNSPFVNMSPGPLKMPFSVEESSKIQAYVDGEDDSELSHSGEESICTSADANSSPSTPPAPSSPSSSTSSLSNNLSNPALSPSSTSPKCSSEMGNNSSDSSFSSGPSETIENPPSPYALVIDDPDGKEEEGEDEENQQKKNHDQVNLNLQDDDDHADQHMQENDDLPTSIS